MKRELPPDEQAFCSEIRGAVGVLGEIAAERTRQDAKWGPQSHKDGTGPNTRVLAYVDINLDLRTGAELARGFRNKCQANKIPNWRDILLEEVFEALAEADPGALRTELIQVAAVAVAWVEAIDRRAGNMKGNSDADPS